EFSGWFVDRWKWVEKNVSKGLAWMIANLKGLDPAEVMANVEDQYGREQSGRQQARADRLSNIESGRSGALAALEDARQKAHADRKARYDEELADSAAKLKKAQDDFAASLAEARSAREAVDQQRIIDEWFSRGGPGGAAAAGQAAAAATKVAGTFSAEAATRLGMGGGVQERTAKAAEEIAENTRPLKRVRQLTWK
ncbi:MAG: hypothetical protein ABIK89_18920, partial [Planctomycetota bacterium]